MKKSPIGRLQAVRALIGDIVHHKWLMLRARWRSGRSSVWSWVGCCLWAKPGRKDSAEPMPKAIVFDLFETLITESGTRPRGVSSLAGELGCERDRFRKHWKAIRPEVTVGRISFRQALKDISVRLGGVPDEALLDRLCDARRRVKAEPLIGVESEILVALDSLRQRGLRLGVISNCFAEDVSAWPQSSLASRFDCAVFSFEVGVAKPNPAIYLEAIRRLRVDVSEAWFVGDGENDELHGAEESGIHSIRALWFLKRWPHFELRSMTSIDATQQVDEIAGVVELL